VGAELSGLGEMASGRKGGFLGLRRLLGGRKEPTHG
jgi:hypothetical protein